MKKIYMIGNTHFDPVWLWRWDEAMSAIHATFRSALDRMEEDGDFIYSFATPPVFEWIKQIDAEMFEEIKKRVKEGRWELCEGMWLQPDCFSACGESYARQLLHGQKYLMDNFGVYADTVFNVDSFGHNLALPQLFKKSYIDYYCMCRPEQRHIPLDSPHFNWVGKDKSVVETFRVGQYSEIYNKDMETAVSSAKAHLEKSDCDEMMLYGVTDHGGAPTKKAIADIHRLDGTEFSTVSGFFKAQSEPKVTLRSELITGDFGPYTNNHRIKKLNRLAEYALKNAETASVIAKNVLGKEYPADSLDKCVKDIMFCQFHDILGGACIKEAYFDAYNQLGRAILTSDEITQFALQSITKKIDMSGDMPWNIVVWNTSAKEYDGYIEAEVQWLHEFDAYDGGVELYDEDGNIYPCQIILSRSVIKGFRSRFVFKAKIQPVGYKVFSLRQTGEKAEAPCKHPDTSVMDMIKPVCFADDGDTWCFNTDGYGNEPLCPALESTEVTERGIHRTTFKRVYRFNSSLIELYYTFYDEDYFDIRYNVNWNEKHTVLKLACDFGCDTLYASAPFYCEKREDSDWDKPMGEWVTVSKDGKNVSVFADSLFSYSKSGGTLMLSVLRSCIYGDLRLCELDENADYPYMEQGICEGRLRVLFHGDDCDIPNIASQFNCPPVVITDTNHKGYLERQDSFVSIGEENVIISAIKKCEYDDGYIVRLCNYTGEIKNTTLEFFDKSFDITLSPFEIQTLKITDTIEKVNIIEK